MKTREDSKESADFKGKQPVSDNEFSDSFQTCPDLIRLAEIWPNLDSETKQLILNTANERLAIE